MKFEEKFKIDDKIVYVWRMEDIKDEKSCMELAFKIAKLWKKASFYFRGYSDMDTHGNEAGFSSEEEVRNASDVLKKIDPDDVTVSACTPDGIVEVIVWLPEKCDKGTTVSVYGPESLVKKTSSEIKKIVGA